MYILYKYIYNIYIYIYILYILYTNFVCLFVKSHKICYKQRGIYFKNSFKSPRFQKLKNYCF